MNNNQNTQVKGSEWIKIKFIPDIEEFEPIPLPNKDGQTLTRKIVKATFVNPNPKNPDAPLKINICHQRRKSDGSFEDCEHFDLRNSLLEMKCDFNWIQSRP